ncbi:endolytic transglycosylase MltG [Clostridium sp. LY3-2]|uniref:endolytic transglycosylase MltG n=1 Tax=Clostridium sp. LY3-2 TaxID=2942482 RepID=UPI0021527A60|nr:endolytic transglycosylase MltG [Clostridium sp. LY3-2]MCR6515442.1 endolytic transglycosylase MltG [Clostridium sp. LY3-2]
MKRTKKKIIGALCIAAIIVIGGVVYTYSKNTNNPIKSSETSVTIDVNKGEAFYTLLDRLKGEGILRSEFMTKLYLKINGISPKVIPGTYTIDSDTSLKELLTRLQTEDNLKVTIPEGYDISEIGNKLQEAGLFTKDEFIKAVENYKLPSFIKEVPGRRYQLEGYLFPDTYAIPKGSSPDYVIQAMLKRFKAEIDALEKQYGVTLNAEQIDELVTKASIIENEARVDKERPIIASVINNRLKTNMPLQIDATVIYALGKHVDVVTYKDLKVDSKYNTYKNKGLPIGPISNPGKKSLEAALKPASTDYLYYILVPGTNEHKFTKSGNEFNEFRKKYGYDD